MGYEIDSAYSTVITTPFEDGSFDDVAHIAVTFGQLYEDDCFPDGLPRGFDVLHFEDMGYTRLSYYAEYYGGRGAVSDAKRDTREAIIALLRYACRIEEQGFHFILQMGRF